MTFNQVMLFSNFQIHKVTLLIKPHVWLVIIKRVVFIFVQNMSDENTY